jgi:TatD DNase family protein
VDSVYHFGDPSRLYLNVTNRCTNRCRFCVRFSCRGLGGATLWGDREPELDELVESVGRAGRAGQVQEIVWCGFGEPSFRLDLIRAASPLWRAAGVRIRLNTNGHASLIHGRDVTPELAEVVDVVSVSLNVPSCERYLELCRPDPGQAPGEPSPESFWEATCAFVARAQEHPWQARASVVGHVLTLEEIAACRELAATLGCHDLRVR